MNDVLEQFFGGAAKTPPKPTGGSSVITDQLLDNLRRVESGGDRFALNKQSKAMGAYQFLPEQVITMHKKGIEFNPLNEAESRQAAKTYLEQLVKEKGSVEKALATYGGFITKDPTEYVNKVLKAPAAKANATTTTTAAPAAQSTAAPADPLEAFLSGKPATTAQPTAVQPVADQLRQPAAETTASTQEGTMGAYVPRRQPVNPVRQILGKVLQKGFEAKQALGQDLGERVAGAIDTVYGIVPATYGAGVQALARTAQTPEQAERTGQAAAATIDKPLGKALGITGKPTYQQPLGGVTEPIAEQVNKMFNVLGMTPEQISEKTGIPAPDIRNMVVIGSVALPQAVKEVAPVVKQVVKPLQQAAGELEIVRPGQLTKAEAQAQFEARQAPAGSVGAAGVQNNPFAGKITGEETVRGQFPQVKLSKTPTDVPVNEQIIRSQLVQEIMPNGAVRPGVVTGNENLLRNEYTKAKLDTPEGQVFKQQIANEQAALSKFAEDRVNATGASRSLINDEQRGGRINDVMYGTSQDDLASSSLTGYLNQAKKQIYDSAYEQVGNNKINSSFADKLFVDPQIRATFRADGTLDVLKGAKDLIELAKTVGFKLPDGTIAPPGSVAAFDAVRKSMNKLWKPEKANAIREINQAIDKDIAAVADPALYKLGDKVHQVEKTIFGSKGIKNLFGEVDANGVVTSSTPLEKIPSKLNNLPKDQWRHIRDTLDELANGRVRGAPDGLPAVPPELQQAAAAARAEIDGALAREVQKAGAGKMGEWNQNSANNVMNSVVGQKILETFPADEIRKFHALNYAGHLMPGVHGYEGAALQARRVGMIEGNLPKIGAGAGAAVGGFVGEVPGAAAGTYLGQQAGAKYAARMEQNALTKAAKKAQKEMEKAKALGQQTGQNKVKDLGK
jgi:hypothetical protein